MSIMFNVNILRFIVDVVKQFEIIVKVGGALKFSVGNYCCEFNMSHSMLLDMPNCNATISPSYMAHNTSKMNGNVSQLSHRHIANGPLDSSKHSIGTVTASTNTAMNIGNNTTVVGSSPVPVSRIPHSPRLTPRLINAGIRPGIDHTMASLALMCVTSLFVSLIALMFLQNIEPNKVQDVNNDRSGQLFNNHYLISSQEFLTVYDVAICLATLVIALNLCCLFVCSLQFLFAAKLLRTSHGFERASNFLCLSSQNRALAISGFFLSIPLFFTALILHIFINFHSTPALATSIVIGIAILFCGLASIYNVFVWQREKARSSTSYSSGLKSRENSFVPTTFDLTLPHMELSTLV